MAVIVCGSILYALGSRLTLEEKSIFKSVGFTIKYGMVFALAISGALLSVSGPAGYKRAGKIRGWKYPDVIEPSGCYSYDGNTDTYTLYGFAERGVCPVRARHRSPQ
jgi:hypothetical protein